MKYLCLMCGLSFVLAACTAVQPTVISTATKVPPTVTQTITATLTPTSVPTATPFEWLPYNPNLSDTGCEPFTASIPIQGTADWSEEQIGRKLFESYLEHYKNPALGGLCRIEDYVIEELKFDERIAYLTRDQKMDITLTVQYSIQVREAPSNWVAGNGELAAGGWIVHKFLIIGIIHDGEQYVLHLIGTGP